VRIPICHLITDLETGGAERSLVNLVTGLDPARFHNEVVSLVEPGPMAQELTAFGIAVTSLRMRRGRPTLSALAALVHHLRGTRPAILQTWLYHADFIGTVAACVARPGHLLWNVRCTDITNAPTEKPIRWLVRSLAFLSGRPDAVVVNSQRGQRDHEALGYHPKSWVNIPNGVDPVRFRVRRSEQAALRAQLGLHANAFVIGLIARFHPMKDVETFLRAAALFTQSRADAQFVLCGSGFDADNGALAALIAGFKLVGRFFLLGRRADTQNIYPALDVLTLCSIYGEGFPNVICESMACGVPCVVTDVGDSASMVGDTGVVVPMRDGRALSDGWQNVAARGAQALGDRARARVESHYSLDRMRARYAALYESIAVSGRAPPA
jgi:glycosyltransferase involved in cell wall biosynthesis